MLPCLLAEGLALLLRFLQAAAQWYNLWLWLGMEATSDGQEHCECGRKWAKLIEQEAKAEQASWHVPTWPMWTPPKGGGNKGTKAELGKVSSALSGLAGPTGNHTEGLDEGGL